MSTTKYSNQAMQSYSSPLFPLVSVTSGFYRQKWKTDSRLLNTYELQRCSNTNQLLQPAQRFLHFAQIYKNIFKAQG